MSTVNPAGLNHDVVFVTDRDRAERSYTDVIGMLRRWTGVRTARQLAPEGVSS